jgi:glycosyltransferase involved in cell wall biosynthesis
MKTSLNLKVLYVAYPLLTVSDESAGGAEQVLWTLEREIAQRGAHTTVAASVGSRVTGELFPTGEACIQPDDYERRTLEHQENTITLVRQRAQEGRGFDLIHDMSGSFWTRAAEVDLPVLATLHLPRSFYPAGSFSEVAENVRFNCVSDSQASSFADVNGVVGVVPNGIALDRFRDENGPNAPGEPSNRQGLLWLGRICEEKAPHLALEIAARAGLPITLAGQVYPFSYHQKYFEREVASRLRQMRNATFLSPPSFEAKRRLLREARAVLITSLADETSSLVAMEAAASGTPVIAFRRGALPEVVREQLTGFLVEGVEDGAGACGRLSAISNVVCTAYASHNFSSTKMVDAYARLYDRVLRRARQTVGASVL